MSDYKSLATTIRNLRKQDLSQREYQSIEHSARTVLVRKGRPGQDDAERNHTHQVIQKQIIDNP